MIHLPTSEAAVLQTYLGEVSVGTPNDGWLKTSHVVSRIVISESIFNVPKYGLIRPSAKWIRNEYFMLWLSPT